MKNILVPTDFSDTATNAVKYAIELASLLDAKLTVLYVHTQEVVVIDSLPVNLVYTEYLQVPDSVHKQMKKIKELVAAKPDLKARYLIKEGGVTEEVITQVQETEADLIVMGTEGVDSAYNLLWGSETVSIIGKRKCPVLAVPGNFTGTIKKGADFVFATDFERINDWYVLNLYKLLAQKLEAHINVFFVSKHGREKEDLEYEEDRYEMLKEYFDGLDITLIHSYEKDILHAVETFVKAKHATLITMISHERTFLENLFHKSITKEMALNTKVPFLAIPDAHLELNKSYEANYW